MPLRLAVATENLNSNLKRAIAMAGNGSADGVQLNSRHELEQANASESSLRQIRLYVTEREMKVASLFCPTRHALYADDFLEPRLGIIRKSMSIARTLQTDHVIVKCGRIPNPDHDTQQPQQSSSAQLDLDTNPFSLGSTPKPTVGMTSAERFQMLVEILNDLTQHGNHVGCRLSLLLPNYQRDLVDSLLKKVTNGPISIAFDPATAELSGESSVNTFRDLYSQVSYLRARDTITNSDGGGDEVPIGSGVVDWIQLIPTLAEADFDGWVSVHQKGGPEIAESCLAGVSHLRDLFPRNPI
ncbi:MAG: TIM barrel protein [Fuerstiella sp.]